MAQSGAILLAPQKTEEKTRAYKVKPRPDLHPEAHEYSDGSVRRPGDHGTGAVWVTKPPGAAVTIDETRSQVLHDRKAAKRDQQRADYRAEAQRALVAELARGKSPAVAGGVLVGNVARELAAQGAAKEHGLKNYTGASDWVLKQSDLIQEKEKGTVNIETFQQLNLNSEVADRVRRLLSRDEG